MEQRFVSFSGEHIEFGKAVSLANLRANEWMERTGRTPADAVHISAASTLQFSKTGYMHQAAVTLWFANAIEVDVELLEQIRKSFQDVHWVEPKQQQSRGRMRPKRTERQEREIIAQNNKRAQTMGAPGELRFEDWKALCEHFGHMCLSCELETLLTIDHVIPLALGGTNMIENVQPLCRACNSSKKRKTTDHRDPAILAAFLKTLPADQDLGT